MAIGVGIGIPFHNEVGIANSVLWAAEGDSNTKGADFGFETYANFVYPAAMANTAEGGSGMIDAIPFTAGHITINRIAALKTNNPTAIAVGLTCFTNEIRWRIEIGDTVDEAVSYIWAAWLDLSLKCLEEGLFPVVATQHYLGNAIDVTGGWADQWDDPLGRNYPTATNPWDINDNPSATGQVDSESIIDILNGKLIAYQGATSWFAGLVAEQINEPTDSPGDKGMKDDYDSNGGAHWNELASTTVVRQQMQIPLSQVVAFTPQKLTFSSSVIKGITYLPNHNADVVWEWEEESTDLSGAQSVMGGDTAPGDFANFWHVQNSSGGSNTKVMWAGFPQSTHSTTAMVVNTEYTMSATFPGASVTVGVFTRSGVADTTDIVDKLGTSPPEFIIGASTLAGGTPFKGHIKNIRLYEDGIIVRDWRINDGVADGGVIKDLVSGDDGELVNGGGWVGL